MRRADGKSCSSWRGPPVRSASVDRGLELTVYVRQHTVNIALAPSPRCTLKTADDELSLAWIRRTPGHLIRRCHQVAVGLFMEDLAHDDVTPVQLAALAAIADSDDLDATRLAELVAFDRSTVGSVLERLEAKGWIEREYRDGDRRTKRLHATAAGRAKIRSLTAAMRASQARLLDVFSSEEQTQFQRLLAKFVSAHEERRAGK